MAEYDPAVLALRLITKKGRRDGALFRREQAPAADPAKPWKSAAVQNVAVAENFAVLVLDAKVMLSGSSKGAAMVEALAPEATAVAFIAAASLPAAPEIGDVLGTKGARYSVLDVEDLSPGEQSVLYTLHLKG